MEKDVIGGTGITVSWVEVLDNGPLIEVVERYSQMLVVRWQ